MKHLAFHRLFAFGLALLATTPAFAQITLTIQATDTLTPNYDAGFPEEHMPASLSITSNSTHPASLDYTDLTSGTFTLNFLAPTGYKFVITPHGEDPVGFYFQVAYTTYQAGGAPAGLTSSTPGSLFLLGLEGTAPNITASHTMGDIPHAYFAVSVDGEASESFSFSGFQYTFDYTGTGENVSVPYFEGGELTVSSFGYSGLPPPDHTTILTLNAIPEPSTYAALVGAAALGVAAYRRRKSRQ